MRLSKELGVPVTQDKARKLWAKYGLKPCPGTSKGHFKNPGINKYKKYFHKGHFKVFQKHGLISTAKEFGYETDSCLKQKKEN